MKGTTLLNKSYRVCCLALPFFISAIVYLNSLQNTFVYDDESTIVCNYFIRHWGNLPGLFTKNYFTLSAELTYRPMVTLTYFVDYALWGMHPFGYHLTNVLLHGINSILLYILAFQLFKRRFPAVIAAVIFSSHPVFTEAVNAVAFREDLLAFMFFALAFFCYLKAGQGRYFVHYPLSLACYLFGLFSKEMAITLPAVIIFYDVVILGVFGRNRRFPLFAELKSRVFRFYMGYAFVTAFYIAIRFWALHSPTESRIPYPQDSLSFNFLAMAHVLACYVKLFFLPFRLNADYCVPYPLSFAQISFWLSTFLFVVIGVCSFRLQSKRKQTFFLVLWFFVALIPVMNIIPLGNIMAERYLYLPGAGFCMAVASFLANREGDTPCRTFSSHSQNEYPRNACIPSFVRGRTLRLAASCGVSCILAVNAYLTITRNNDWRDGLQLWSRTAITTPNSFRAHVNLGTAYEKMGLNAASLESYQKALLLDPNDEDVYNNLGVYYNKVGAFDDAILHYKKCLNLNPNHFRAYNNLGVTLTRQRRLDEAIDAFRRALSLNNLYPDAHNNLGIAYYRKGDMDEAEREFKLAVSIEPYHAEAHNDLGILYNDRRLFDSAIKEFETAIWIKPSYPNAHLNLGAVLHQHRNDRNGALFHLKESLRLDPGQAQAVGIAGLIQQIERMAH